MKTLVHALRFALVALISFASVSRAQTGGSVNFGNNLSNRVINGLTSLPVTSSSNTVAALYWSPLGSNTFTKLGANVTVGNPLAGIFAGGTRFADAATLPGTAAHFQVRAWGGGYASYEQAAVVTGTLVGTSAVLQVTTGNPLGVPPTPPASLVAAGLQSFTLNPASVPPLTTHCASDKTAICGSAWSFDPPTTSGGCGTVTVSIASTITNGGCPWLITRTWQATDGCTTNMCSQTVTITDITPPNISCSGYKTVQCGSAWDFDAPSASDECDLAYVAILETTTNAGCGITFTATRKWIATDACGNTNSCSQTVAVVDATPPVITCVGGKTITCGAAWDFDPPTAADSCNGTNVSISVVSTVTNSACPLVVTRSWLATDACGNTNSCSQTITALNFSPPTLTCVGNKIVSCTNAWDFDPPLATDECGGTNVTVATLETITNSLCPLSLTRTWAITNACDTNFLTCNQTVTVICPGCPVLVVTKSCPTYPVPPGGTLAWTGTVTNISDVTVSNVVVVNDQPAPNTQVFGPAILAPGQGASFGGSYNVAACSCGPHTDTLTASGVALNGIEFTGSATASCAGTNHITPGDMNGDGIVDQSELNAVLANYWAHSPWIYMTNATLLCDGRFQFELTNAGAWGFTVLVSTNLVDWTNLPAPAFPVFQFTDPAGTNEQQRLYRLQWP